MLFSMHDPQASNSSRVKFHFNLFIVRWRLLLASFSVSLKQQSPLALGTGAGEKFPAGKNIGKKNQEFPPSFQWNAIDKRTVSFRSKIWFKSPQMISSLTLHFTSAVLPQLEICRVEVWDNSFILFKEQTFSCQVEADRFANTLLTMQLIEGLMENSAMTLTARNWGRKFMFCTSFSTSDALSTAHSMRLQSPRWLLLYGIPHGIQIFLKKHWLDGNSVSQQGVHSLWGTAGMWH